MHLGPFIHWLTREGGEVAGETLPVPKAINCVTYLHDTMLVDLAENLVARTGGEFVPERRLRAELKAEGQQVLTHLLASLLYLDDRKPIAIELELSLKAAAEMVAATSSPIMRSTAGFTRSGTSSLTRWCVARLNACFRHLDQPTNAIFCVNDFHGDLCL